VHEPVNAARSERDVENAGLGRIPGIDGKMRSSHDPLVWPHLAECGTIPKWSAAANNEIH
jgi:hypothetical protein